MEDRRIKSSTILKWSTSITDAPSMKLASLVQRPRLFAVGATVGPLVDSLHNQCLLEYHTLPLVLPPNAEENPWICSSWIVPPLLGVAYVVLGSVLPGLFRKEAIDTTSNNLRTRAVAAVLSTAAIIQLSEFLELSSLDVSTSVTLLFVAALVQWAVLDKTLPALVVATAASIGGPLAELPFVAHDAWTYLPSAADYFPLQAFSTEGLHSLSWLLGDAPQTLGLAHITAPCYFAVTMDAIALGRWLQEET